jgi:hypothetical protein
MSHLGQALWFLAVFGGMTRLRSSKSQAPSSKQAPSPKPQQAALDGVDIVVAQVSKPVWNLRSVLAAELPGAYWRTSSTALPHRSGLGLDLEIWSFFGAWSLELGA